MTCDMAERRLHAWLDGEARERTGAVQAHVSLCKTCASRVTQLRQAHSRLLQHVDAAVGEVEPLRALQRIRGRMDQAATAPRLSRAAAWLGDLWRFERPHAMGVGLMLGAILGALALAQLTLADRGQSVPAAVVVEHLQTPGDSRARVLQTAQGSMTLIWVETTPRVPEPAPGTDAPLP